MILKLFLGAREHDGADDRLLEHAKEHQHGKERKHGRGNDDRTVIPRIGCNVTVQPVERLRHVIPLVGVDEHLRTEIVVPCPHEAQDPLRHDRGHAERNNELPEDPP